MTLRLQSRKEKETNREYAYRILRSNIMTLHLPPGSVLNENELAEDLGISRTPVHEAIIKLKSEYLVDVFPQSSSRVSLIDLEIVKEGVFLRSVAEPAILQRIAGQTSPESLLLLKQNLEQQKSLLELDGDDNIDTYFNLDDEFHHIMYNIANKPKTWYSVKAICSHYDRVRYITAIIDKVDLKMLYSEHKTIYHLILLGQTSGFDVDQFYNNHLWKFQQDFENLTEQYANYFLL
jgi:GntR family transcriptional regulator, rspAB operon transcriptional repressor